MGFGPPRVPTIEPPASQMPRKRKIAIWFILMATAACMNFSLKNPVWSFSKTFTESEHEKKTEIYKKFTTEIMESQRTNGTTCFPTNGGYFPDSVSSRASRHVKELETLVKDGAQ